MGFSIALTGIVLFFFFAFITKISKQEPVTWGGDLFACIAMIGLFLIPAGLIIQIWQ